MKGRMGDAWGGMTGKQHKWRGVGGKARGGLREGGEGGVKKWHEGTERSKPGGKSKRSFYWKNRKNKFLGFNLAKKEVDSPETG